MLYGSRDEAFVAHHLSPGETWGRYGPIPDTNLNTLVMIFEHGQGTGWDWSHQPADDF